jgi:uncharacterized membrane protein YqaE (UPF0057 family)
MNLLRILLSVLVPPLGAFFTVGLRAGFWVNVVLTLLGFIPGLVHAVWLIAGGSAPGDTDLLRVLASVFLPPLGVAMGRGLGLAALNLVLTLLGYLPGLVHAVWVLARSQEAAHA